MRTLLSALCVGLLVLSASSADVTNAVGILLDAEGYTAVPLKLCGVGQYTVDVMIIGQRFDFLLDSGSSFSLIDPSVVKKLGLPLHPKHTVKMAEITGRKRQHRITEPMAIEIGDMLLPPLQFAVVELQPISKLAAAREVTEIHGIIGSSILRRHRAVIDYGSEVLYLRAPKRPRP